MNRRQILEFTSTGLRIPIATDLVLREVSDAEAVLLDGVRLGRVVEQAAHRYRSPMAFPLMDLNVEKEQLAVTLGKRAEESHGLQLTEPLDRRLLDRIKREAGRGLCPRLAANVGAVGYIAHQTSLVPVGMCVGPFSLATQLMSDPITAAYFVGESLMDELEAQTLLSALEVAQIIIEAAAVAQIAAGAQMMIVCEPAANQMFISPMQMEQGSEVFERLVMAPNLRLRHRFAEREVELLLHDCGELSEPMLGMLVTLDPAILSLGSSRCLWEDAAVVPNSIVLYGNLPSKKFYSDDEITEARVAEMVEELERRMRKAGHPFILGSECDVLHVDGCAETIKRKVALMLSQSPENMCHVDR